MTAETGKQRTFLGHPLGLYVLFFTEMWERFSYYGMRALLMLYMLNYFKWAQKDASSIYKIYTSFVYVTPILGGYLADRFLGNRLAVIIGAVLMAIGHFLMGFEEYPIFMSALVFLILGNGFFKPNMSTQVGRLYPPNDGRLDGAYTIFYMGINLGAFLSPILCGWLAANTVGEYHSGFTLAGIGMVLSLAIYLLGQPLVKEVAHEPTPSPQTVEREKDNSPRTLSEGEAAAQPTVLGPLGRFAPVILAVLGLGVVALACVLLYSKRLEFFDAVFVAIGGGCLLLLGVVCSQVTGGLRDRVLAILILGIFVVFFWAAFEQGGNVLNVWADQSTNRFLSEEAPPATVIPTVIEDKLKKGNEEKEPRAHGYLERFLQLFTNMVTLKPKTGNEPEKPFWDTVVGWFNPMPTAWFQSINAVAIFLLAPFFAWLWIFLDRRGWQPSIPMKMFFGLVFMSASMAIMLGAANQEQRRSTVKWTDRLPAGIVVTADNTIARLDKEGKPVPFHAGRLTVDPKASLFIMDGVLDENERDRLIESTAPAEFRKKVEELQKQSQKIDDDKFKSVEVSIDNIPSGFDMKFAGLKKSVVQFKDNKLIAKLPLADKEVKALLVAGGDPAFRSAIHDLFIESTTFRVSPMWLFWSYILATLGELCLSPVGLSMVSKLAPAKFATMLMGVWLLTSSFGLFVAGTMGEIWGTIPPTEFFLLLTAVLAGAALVLLVLVRLITKTMHGVK